MIYSFKTKADDQQWIIDTEALTWARSSGLVISPSVIAAEANMGSFVPIEEGKLTAMGGGRYVLEGRKPFDESGKPQLSILILLSLLSADNQGTCVTFIQSNMELDKFQHQPIKNFATEVMHPIQLNPKGTKGVGKLCTVPPINENINTK